MGDGLPVHEHHLLPRLDGLGLGELVEPAPRLEAEPVLQHELLDRRASSPGSIARSHRWLPVAAVAAIAFAAYAAVLVWIYMRQESLLFYPVPLRPNTVSRCRTYARSGSTSTARRCRHCT